jgi:hypothetical protein
MTTSRGHHDDEESPDAGLFNDVAAPCRVSVVERSALCRSTSSTGSTSTTSRAVL